MGTIRHPVHREGLPSGVEVVRESCTAVREVRLAGLRKTSTQSWTGSQFSTLNSSMTCPPGKVISPWCRSIAASLFTETGNRG